MSKATQEFPELSEVLLSLIDFLFLFFGSKNLSSLLKFQEEEELGSWIFPCTFSISTSADELHKGS